MMIGDGELYGQLEILVRVSAAPLRKVVNQPAKLLFI
jgi:hypothetical protein